MSSRFIRLSLAFLISFFATIAFAQTDGLKFDELNPLTPYMLQKKNIKRSIKVPYAAIVEYYKFVAGDFLQENTDPLVIRDLESREMGIKKEELEFFMDVKYRKAYPASVLSPDSVSSLFLVNPVGYAAITKSPDFLTAKKEIYKDRAFHLKKLRYFPDFIQLEDWRSLNHPPVAELGSDLTVWDKQYAPVDYTSQDSEFYSPEFHLRVDKISETELTFGNKTHLLENGLSYERKLIEVKNAKRSILMAVMSFFCDESSRILEDLLIEKVKEGLDVKLMVEKVWTKLIMKRCLNRMIKGGVDVVLANDLLKSDQEMALFHDKFMVIDGKKVIVGGANIMTSDNISTGMNHMNRDNDVYVEGPVATDATLTFARLWRRFVKNKNVRNISERVKDISFYEEVSQRKLVEERAKGLRGKDVYFHKLTDKSTRSNGVCRFMAQGPESDRNRVAKTMIEYIKVSKNMLNMTNGSNLYFDLPEHKEKERNRDTWNKRLFQTIFEATSRGVKLDIVGNGRDGGYGEASNMFKRAYLRKRFKNDPIRKGMLLSLANLMDRAAARTNQPFLEFLAKAKNTRVWTHFQYMHSKKFQFDRLVTAVTSFNLEEWSGDKSHETAVFCMDDKLNDQMTRSMLLDMVNSTPAFIREAPPEAHAK